MSGCTNNGVGKLLHGYEIGILSELDCDMFETHLLECEYCHNSLREFEQKASLLKTSGKARAVIDEVLMEAADKESLLGRIWNHIWPRTPFVFKPAVAYLLIMILIIPAFQGLRRSEVPSVNEIKQTINLIPTRTTAKALTKEISDNALLMFRFEGCHPGGKYKVMIESEDGDIIYLNNNFVSFDEREIGSLNLTISRMKIGIYRMTITDMQTDSSAVGQEYWFRIEE
jgi:hypothetical protein